MAQARTDGFQSGQVRPDTVSDIFGLKVYTKSGFYLGTVEDIRLNFDMQSSTGLALTDVNPELEEAADLSKNGVVIPYNWVESVNDIVLTINLIERLHTS